MFVVSVGEAMINGLPLPTNDPPQVVLNHDNTVPDLEFI